jgi:hypothetical protein
VPPRPRQEHHFLLRARRDRQLTLPTQRSIEQRWRSPLVRALCPDREQTVAFDGGATWRSNGPLPLRPGDTTGADTTVAFNAQGVGFVAAVVGRQSEEYAVLVWRTDDGGRSFARPVPVYQARPGWSSDHHWLAVDTAHGTHAGSVYVSWVAGQNASWGTSAELLFSRSVDGGHSFATPRSIVRFTQAYPHVPVMTLGPEGAIHMVYYVVARAQGTAETPLAVVSSTDGGRTFGVPHIIGATPELNFPQMPTRNSQAAADPRDGTLYVAASGYQRDMQHAAILLWRSRDGGRSWAGPTAIDQIPSIGPADAFQPRIAVTSHGTVYVSTFAYAHGRVDVVLARSTTHGASFRPGQRITGSSFDPFANPLATPWLGDYQGLAGGAGTIHPFWNGTAHGGRMELFTTAVPGD